jgi:hypothetical protein
MRCGQERQVLHEYICESQTSRGSTRKAARRSQFDLVSTRGRIPPSVAVGGLIQLVRPAQEPRERGQDGVQCEPALLTEAAMSQVHESAPDSALLPRGDAHVVC